MSPQLGLSVYRECDSYTTHTRHAHKHEEKDIILICNRPASDYICTNRENIRTETFAHVIVLASIQLSFQKYGAIISCA